LFDLSAEHRQWPSGRKKNFFAMLGALMTAIYLFIPLSPLLKRLKLFYRTEKLRKRLRLGLLMLHPTDALVSRDRYDRP
jgi:flagellar biogenesis protein FliO